MDANCRRVSKLSSGGVVHPKENSRELSRRSVGESRGRSWGAHLASDHVIDISKSKRYRDGASGGPFRVE